MVASAVAVAPAVLVLCSQTMICGCDNGSGYGGSYVTEAAVAHRCGGGSGCTVVVAMKAAHWNWKGGFGFGRDCGCRIELVSSVAKKAAKAQEAFCDSSCRC